MMHSYFNRTSLELAKRTGAYLTLGAGDDAGNGVYDGFDHWDHVDLAGATNTDSSAAGVLTPTRGRVSSSTPTVATGAYTTASFMDLSHKLTNGKTYGKFGAFSSAARTIPLKVRQALGSGLYGVAYTVGTLAHPGGGWADISGSYSVPGSGDYYLAGYIASGWVETNVSFRASITGDPTSPATFAESSSANTLALRAIESTALAMSVSSTAILVPSAPELALFDLLVRPNGATANTDFVLSLTRDGADWKSVTLTEAYARPDGSFCYSTGEVDLTDIDTGTTCKWRWQTANGKAPDLLGIGGMFGVGA